MSPENIQIRLSVAPEYGILHFYAKRFTDSRTSWSLSKGLKTEDAGMSRAHAYAVSARTVVDFDTVPIIRRGGIFHSYVSNRFQCHSGAGLQEIVG